MTRRRVIFYNDLNSSYIISEEYNGDKTEMERFGCGTCDHDWPEFMEAMSDVTNLRTSSKYFPGSRLAITPP